MSKAMLAGAWLVPVVTMVAIMAPFEGPLSATLDVRQDHEDAPAFVPDPALRNLLDAIRATQNDSALPAAPSLLDPEPPAAPNWLDAELPAGCGGLSQFVNGSQLLEMMGARYGPNLYRADGTFDSGNRVIAFSMATVQADGMSDSDSLSNNQVAGVDESDFVKTDGNWVYINDGTSVVVMRLLDSGLVEMKGRLALAGGFLGMLIPHGKLVLILRAAGTAHEIDSQYGSYYWNNGEVQMLVYDRTSFPLKLERSISIGGTYVGARAIDDQVVMVTSFAPPPGTEKLVLPTLTIASTSTVARHLLPKEIAYTSESKNATRIVSVMQVNVSSDSPPFIQSILANAGSTLFVSGSGVYLAGNRHGTRGNETIASAWTSILKIPIRRGGVDCAAQGEVPGRVQGSFSFDEYGGFLRVATQLYDSQSRQRSAGVYVLDDGLSMVGSITGIAPGEIVYATRFAGPRLFLVTFLKVDPFFVVDLSVPAQPRILGQLKIPGVSHYLHPISATLVVSVGLDTADSGSASFAWFQGLKVALYDVADVQNPKEISKFIIGDRGSWTPVRNNHLAFTWLPARSALVLPVHVFEINRSVGDEVRANTRGQEIWQGAYVIEATREKGLRLVQRITHHQGADEPEGCSTYAYRATEGIERSFESHGALYTVSRERVQLNAFGSWTLLSSIQYTAAELSTPRCPWTLSSGMRD